MALFPSVTQTIALFNYKFGVTEYKAEIYVYIVYN